MPLSPRPELYNIVQIISESGADVVIIGGLALQILGGDYVTLDVDFAFERRRENAKRIADALSPYHPRPVDWPDDLPFVWDDQTIMNSTVLTLTTDIGRIDLLAQPDGAPPYRELSAGAEIFELEGREVRVACVDDLIAMKKAAGRPKDLGHAAELETIKRLMAEGSS